MRKKLAAVLTITALTVATATAASAGTKPSLSPTPALSHAQPIPPSQLTPAPPLPPGVPLVGPPLRITSRVAGHAGRTRRTVVGYAICLVHSPNNCLSDTGNPNAALAAHVPWYDWIGAVGGGITIITTVYSGTKKVYKVVKKFFYKGKHTYAEPDDGYCMGNFSKGGQITENNCGDHHGIYWYFHVSGKIQDTYTSGYLAAPGTDNYYVYADNPIPYGWWYTWGGRAVTCC